MPDPIQAEYNSIIREVASLRAPYSFNHHKTKQKFPDHATDERALRLMDLEIVLGRTVRNYRHRLKKLSLQHIHYEKRKYRLATLDALYQSAKNLRRLCGFPCPENKRTAFPYGKETSPLPVSTRLKRDRNQRLLPARKRRSPANEPLIATATNEVAVAAYVIPQIGIPVTAQPLASFEPAITPNHEENDHQPSSLPLHAYSLDDFTQLLNAEIEANSAHVIPAPLSLPRANILNKPRSTLFTVAAIQRRGQLIER